MRQLLKNNFINKGSHKQLMLISIYVLIAFFVVLGFAGAWYVDGQHVQKLSNSAMKYATQQTEFVLTNGSNVTKQLYDEVCRLQKEGAQAEEYRELSKRYCEYICSYNMFKACLLQVDDADYSNCLFNGQLYPYSKIKDQSVFNTVSETPGQPAIVYMYFDETLQENCTAVYVSNEDASVVVAVIINLDMLNSQLNQYANDGIEIAIYAPSAFPVTHGSVLHETDIKGNSIYAAMKDMPPSEFPISENTLGVAVRPFVTTDGMVRYSGKENEYGFYILVGLDVWKALASWVWLLVLQVVLGVFFVYEVKAYIKKLNFFIKQQEDLEQSKSDFALQAMTEFEEPIQTLYERCDELSKLVIPPKSRDFLKQTLRYTKGLERLMKDVETLDKLQKGTFTLNESEFSTEDLIMAIRTYIREEAMDSSRIMFRMEGDVPKMLRGDFERIAQFAYILIYYAENYLKGGVAEFILGYDRSSQSITYDVTIPGIHWDEEQVSQFLELFGSATNPAFDAAAELTILPALTGRILRYMGGHTRIATEENALLSHSTIPVKEVRHE